MRTIEQEVRIGIDSEKTVNAEEAKELGFDVVKDEDKEKTYAVTTAETHLPETIGEAVDEYGEEYILDIINIKKTTLAKLQYDRKYNDAKRILSYDIPAKVKSLEEGYRSMVKMFGKDESILDEVSTKDKLDVERYEATVKDLLGL